MFFGTIQNSKLVVKLDVCRFLFDAGQTGEILSKNRI